MKKCKIFFGNPSKVETDMNEFFMNVSTNIISVTHTEHINTLDKCTHITLILIYI